MAAVERVYVSKEEQVATFRAARAKAGNLVSPTTTVRLRRPLLCRASLSHLRTGVNACMLLSPC